MLTYLSPKRKKLYINLDYSGLKQEERDSLLRLEKDIAKTFADSNEDEMLILRFSQLLGNKLPSLV